MWHLMNQTSHSQSNQLHGLNKWKAGPRASQAVWRRLLLDYLVFFNCHVNTFVCVCVTCSQLGWLVLPVWRSSWEHQHRSWTTSAKIRTEKIQDQLISVRFNLCVFTAAFCCGATVCETLKCWITMHECWITMHKRTYSVHCIPLQINCLSQTEARVWRQGKAVKLFKIKPTLHLILAFFFCVHF